MWYDELIWIDAGHGVSFTIRYEKDGEPSAQGGDPIALYYKHDCSVHGDNAGAIELDVPQNDFVPADAKWQIESVDPLTLSPSLLCRACGHHGFLRNGRWEPC